MEIIIAPHHDDEIIGNFNILMQNNKKVILYYNEMPSVETKRRLIDQIPGGNRNTVFGIFPGHNFLPDNYDERNSTFYFPDPIFETHPLHREIGHIGEMLWRNGVNVVFYSTNMQARYISELSHPDAKRDLLNLVYPEKSDLWKYEHKYFLFEGRCKWIT